MTESFGSGGYGFSFEGVEKCLEIDLDPSYGPEKGLRAMTREQVDKFLTAARCQILSSMSNDKLDSYVLSESSLFVYPHKLRLKTCGTTTLLMCLDPLLEAIQAHGMKIEWVSYTRKDFLNPDAQMFPHRDSQEESGFLKKYFPEGDSFILGPITSDHWFVFVADYVDRDIVDNLDQTLDMMMFGIDEEVAKLFVKDTARFPKDTDVTRASGIDTLLPGSQIQEFCFDPCGYSMNGLLYDSYWTIHITPESHCSYASFETNIRMKNYQPLVKAVLSIFRPRKFTMTVFADDLALKRMKDTPYQGLLPIRVVDSTSQAIFGPCVVTTDAEGNSWVSYPGQKADGTILSGTVSPSAGAGGAAAAAPSLSAASSFTDLAAAAASTAAPAAASSGAGAAPADGEAASAAAGSTAAAGASAPAPIVINTAVGGGAAFTGALSPRSGSSTSKALQAQGKGSRSYVLTSKSQTEFVGEYVCILGNFQMVHDSGAGASGQAHISGAISVDDVSQAAKDKLSMPRAKYVVAKKAVALKTRQRTESI